MEKEQETSSETDEDEETEEESNMESETTPAPEEEIEEQEEMEKEQEEREEKAEELAKEAEEEQKDELLDEKIKQDELEVEKKKAEEKSKEAESEAQDATSDAKEAEKTMEDAAKVAKDAAKVAEHAETEEEKTKALADLDEARADAEEASLKAAEKMHEAERLKRESEIREAMAAADESRTVYNAAKVHMQATETEMNQATADGDLDLVDELRVILEKEKAKVENLLADAKKKQEYVVKLISDAKDAEEDEDEESFLKKLKQHLGDTILEQDSNGFRGVSPALANSALLIPDDEESEEEEGEEDTSDPWISDTDRKTLYGSLLLGAMTCLVTIMMVCFNERTKIKESENSDDEDGSSKEEEDVELAPGKRVNQVLAFKGKLGAVYLRTSIIKDGVTVKSLDGYQDYSHPSGWKERSKTHQQHELVLLHNRVSRDVPMYGEAKNWALEIHSEVYPEKCIYLQAATRKHSLHHADADITCSRGVDCHLLLWSRVHEDQHETFLKQGWSLEHWNDDDDESRNRSVGRYRFSEKDDENKHMEYPEAMYVKKLSAWEKLEYDLTQKIEHSVFFTPQKRRLRLSWSVVFAVAFFLAGAVVLGVAVKDFTD